LGTGSFPLRKICELLDSIQSNIHFRVTPDDRNFQTEGEAIESGLRRTVEGQATVMRSLIRAVYRFRDAILVDERKGDFGSALQSLYRELERAEDLVGPPEK
jgi:hypothetical protein